MNPLKKTVCLSDTPLPARPEESQSTQEAQASKKIKLDTNTITGKHIAKRDVTQWMNYGDPNTWDKVVEAAILDATKRINMGNLKTSDIIGHFEVRRNEIALRRNNPKAQEFGRSRESVNAFYYTKIHHTHLSYGYALERAIKIPYDKKHFTESKSIDCQSWQEIYLHASNGYKLRYGLVQGYIAGQPVPLTQYVFCPRVYENRRYECEKWFGRHEDDYIGTNRESAIWLHTSREQIPIGIKHIEELIQKAIDGDLTVIPRIHWWFVHLAPTLRGSGGIAEMIIKTLCRLHNEDLPPWNEGVAPSIEVLLEPNEEKFCSGYHLLFIEDQEKLKALFKAADQEALGSSTKSQSNQ